MSDSDSVREQLNYIFSRASVNDSVAVAHGYGIQLRVIQNHLVIRDGIGRHRRERKYVKADRTLRRIVVTGTDGYLSLEALTWCAEHDIAVLTLNPHGELISHYAVDAHVTRPDLLRRQATADGLEIAREILTRKVTGQADLLLKLFGDNNTADKLYHYAERMSVSDSISQRQRQTASLSELEGWAGRDYFTVWSNVSVPFDSKSRERIPSNWTSFPGRSSQIATGGKKRNASDPVNAMLNYAYTIGYAEACAACIAHGLNPTLGFVHTDKPGRDSLALDVLEAIRPEIDAYVLGLIGIGSEPRRFAWHDFTEPHGYPPGTVRLVAPLTHEIAETGYTWHKTASDTVQAVVNILTGHQGKRGSAMANWKVHRDTFTTEHVTATDVLPDDVWARFLSLLPVERTSRRGHPPISSRVILAAIVHCERYRRPWAHVPESLGISYRTMTERRRQWQRSGHWPAIKETIDDIV